MKRLLRSASAAALLGALLCAQAAALLTVTAETDRDSVEINGNVYLTVTVAGDSASVPEPKLPNMQNFNVYSSGRSQSISIINGKITTSVSFTYILTPRFIGEQTIPAITVSNGKETAATQPISVNVTRATQGGRQSYQQAAPQRPSRAARNAAKKGEQLFLKASVDRRSAYVGQQIDLSIKFYTSVPLSSNPQYVPPSYKNLISEDLPPVRNGETVINGTRYAYSEIKEALFALTPGPAEVGPAKVVAQVPSDEPVDPFDPNFFQKFMSMSGMQGQSMEFNTDPVRLEIKPLPPGAPADFDGAVGEYTIAATADNQDVKVGEAINFSVTVAGSGNLKAVTAPKFPDLPGFKVFDTMSSLDISKEHDVISGKKVFTYILVPREEGRKAVPPIKFAFFDPKAGAYRELQTAPVSFEVAKGDLNARAVNFSQASAAPVTASGSDIRYVSDEASGSPLPLLAASILGLPWWVHSVPAVLLLLSFWLSRLNRFKLANPLLFRSRRAKGDAARDIGAAEKLVSAGNPNEAVSLLYDSFQDYLSDKCGIKVGAFTMKKAADLIKQRFPGVSERSLQEIRELWEALELRHYSPDASGAEGASDLAKKYSLLLEMLEKELK